jgi:hypothetical protein
MRKNFFFLSFFGLVSLSKNGRDEAATLMQKSADVVHRYQSWLVVFSIVEKSDHESPRCRTVLVNYINC